MRAVKTLTGFSLHTKVERRYWKYQTTEVEISSLPTFDSATEATESKDGLSFSPTTIYPIIARSNAMRLPNQYNYTVTFTFEESFCMKTWNFAGYTIPYDTPSCYIESVKGSNDGTNWTALSNDSSNTTFYKYYAVVFQSGGGVGYYGTMGVSYWNMTGIQRVQTPVPATESDYDYYTDQTTFKAFGDN